MKRIFMCGVLCCLSFLFVGCGCSNSDEQLKKIDEDKLSGKFFEDQKLDSLEIRNFSIAILDDGSYISFEVTNTLETDINLEYIKISLYDEDGYLLMDSYGYVGGTLSALETKQVSVDVDIDLSKVTRVSYEKM